MRITALPLEARRAKWGLFKKRLASSPSSLLRVNVQRLVLAFGLFTIIYLLVSSLPAHAQTSASTAVGNQTSGDQQSPADYAPNLNPDVPRNQHTYVQSAMIEVMSSMICQLAGIDPIRRDQKCLGVDQKTGKIGFVESGGGAIGVVGQFITYTFTPPTSSGDYVRYLSGNFGFPKKTYAAENPCVSDANNAQGVGFCGIKPLIGIWVAMRNIAYLLFVIIFVIIGVAIMLRVHIDPRTVMSIENQIPKIIVGILLVTFSFAIAGFLIDVMYVAIYLIGGVLIGASPTSFPDGVNLGNIATSPTPFDAINRLWPGGEGSLDGGGFGELSLQGQNTVQTLIVNVLGGPGRVTPDLMDNGIIDLIGGGFVAIIGLIVGILAALLIFLGLIFTAIRLWIALVVAYISVLIDIVFAPFWFLIGLFPGSGVGVGAWFKDMLANLAVFPTAIAMFILAKIFSEIAKTSIETGAMFVPPLSGGGNTADAFAGIIALGFLFMTPNVLQITRNAIKAPNINYGPVFKPLGAAGGAAMAGVSTVGAIRMKSPEPGKPGGLSAAVRRGLKI